MRDATSALASANGVAASETPIIECRGLQKWYSGVHALKNVSLKIRRGEILGLVGDNGAGKSTLIKILSGVLQPDSGLTLLEGAEVKIRNPKDAMRLGIETIYQYNSMVPTMTHRAQRVHRPRAAEMVAVRHRRDGSEVDARNRASRRSPMSICTCARPTRWSANCRAGSARGSPSRAR